MPPTKIQTAVAVALAGQRSSHSYRAGGAALHLLALVGREEPRDFLDVLEIHILVDTHPKLRLARMVLLQPFEQLDSSAEAYRLRSAHETPGEST